jgi:hypothetical protein
MGHPASASGAARPTTSSCSPAGSTAPRAWRNRSKPLWKSPTYCDANITTPPIGRQAQAVARLFRRQRRKALGVDAVRDHLHRPPPEHGRGLGRLGQPGTHGHGHEMGRKVLQLAFDDAPREILEPAAAQLRAAAARAAVGLAVHGHMAAAGEGPQVAQRPHQGLVQRRQRLDLHQPVHPVQVHDVGALHSLVARPVQAPRAGAEDAVHPPRIQERGRRVEPPRDPVRQPGPRRREQRPHRRVAFKPGARR